MRWNVPVITGLGMRDTLDNQNQVEVCESWGMSEKNMFLAGSRKNQVCGCLQGKIHEFVWRRKGQISEQAGLVRGKSTDGLSTRNHLCYTNTVIHYTEL